MSILPPPLPPRARPRGLSSFARPFHREKIQVIDEPRGRSPDTGGRLEAQTDTHDASGLTSRWQTRRTIVRRAMTSRGRSQVDANVSRARRCDSSSKQTPLLYCFFRKYTPSRRPIATSEILNHLGEPRNPCGEFLRDEWR